MSDWEIAEALLVENARWAPRGSEIALRRLVRPLHSDDEKALPPAAPILRFGDALTGESCAWAKLLL